MFICRFFAVLFSFRDQALRLQFCYGKNFAKEGQMVCVQRAVVLCNTRSAHVCKQLRTRPFDREQTIAAVLTVETTCLIKKRWDLHVFLAAIHFISCRAAIRRWLMTIFSVRPNTFSVAERTRTKPPTKTAANEFMNEVQCLHKDYTIIRFMLTPLS